MIKIFYGFDSALVDFEFKKYLSECDSNEICFLESLSEIKNNSNQFNLFKTKFIYVFKSINWFSNLDNFKKNKTDLESIKNSCETVILLIYEKMSDAKEISSFLKDIEIHNILVIDKKNIDSYVDKWLFEKNINLTEDIKQKIIDKLPFSSSIINFELSKLIGHKNINTELINKLICDYQEVNIFNLIKEILNKKIKNALNLYKKIICNNYDEILIIQILVTQLVKLIAQKRLIIENYDAKQISQILKLNYYTIINNSILLKNIKLNELYNLVDKLTILDEKMKKNVFDKSNSFKYFLLKLI